MASYQLLPAHSVPSSVYNKPEKDIVPPGPQVPPGASSSPDEVLIPPSLSAPDDQKQYQDLLQQVAAAFSLTVEQVKDPQNQLLDILQLPGPSLTALPIHEAILQPVQLVRHTPASCAPTPMHAERSHLCPISGHGLPFHPLTPQLAGTSSGNQTHLPTSSRVDSSGQGGKKAGPFGRKVYCSMGLQFHITNYRALLAIYYFLTYSRFWKSSCLSGSRIA